MINLPWNKSRLAQIESSAFYKQEMETLDNPNVLAYYEHIIKNVILDPANKMNSFVMWACDKVDQIDLHSPAKINESRSAMPDIDTDFEVSKREQVISYIENQYGEARVAQMITFGKLMGRSALKAVLRAHGACGFDEMNRITEFIPDKAAISDDLQEMLEEDGEASVIRWALENCPDKLREWCFITEQGELQGPMAIYFEQAIRLEGTCQNASKHASAVVASSEDLIDLVPLSYDKGTGKHLIAVEMGPAEMMGLIKNDVLGLNCLDKTASAINIMRYGNPNGLQSESAPAG